MKLTLIILGISSFSYVLYKMGVLGEAIFEILGAIFENLGDILGALLEHH